MFNVVHGVFFAISILIAICMFVFVFGMIFSPNLRSKFMGHQLKMQKKMIDDNADIIEELNSKGAKLSSGGIKTRARAFKEGLDAAGNIFCKHCGSEIDSDSTFCKVCGKKQ